MTDSTQTKFKIDCSPENAHKFADWLATRGGIAVWKSANLGNPGQTWSTPAKQLDGTPTPKPTWQAHNEPSVIVLTGHEVAVITGKLFKAFPVGLQRGSGYSTRLTDGAQRKLDKYMSQCEEKHGNAYYEHGTPCNTDSASMGVFYAGETVSLPDWLAANPKT